MHTKTALPIVEVNVRAVDKRETEDIQWRTLALLDTGSDRSYCTQNLASKLQLEGVPTTVDINTLGHETHTTVMQTNVKVQGVRNQNCKAVILNNVLVVLELPKVLMSHLAQEEDVNKWRHLRELGSTARHTDEVSLLIGLDNPLAMCPLEVRRASDGEPFPVRTNLGWTINGLLELRRSLLDGDWSRRERI